MKSYAWAWTQHLILQMLYSDQTALSLLPNDFAGSCVSAYCMSLCYYSKNKMKLEYFEHARGNNFTYQCNREHILNLEILNNYHLNNLVNQRGNWINKTRCITVVRRDTQKCCTKHNKTKLK